MTGAINVSSDTIKCAMCSATYTANLTTDEFYSSAVSAQIGTPATLASITTTAGVLDAADITYTAVASGTITQLVLYKSTGTDSSSPLIAHIDVSPSVVANGGNIVVSWDSGSARIFKL